VGALKRPAAVLTAFLAASGCARSVNDYLAEARSNAPGAVKDAVIAIGEILLRKQAAALPLDEADREAILYLKEVAASDPVPTNRAVSVCALSKLKGIDAAETFRAALKDSFWLTRLEAVRAIDQQGDESHAELLRDHLAGETRPEVRLAAVKALRRIQGPVALRTLLEVFLQRTERARDPQVQAYAAIREMTRLSYGFDEIGRWEAYYRERFGSAPAGAAPGGAPAAEPGPAKGSGP